MRRSPIEAGRVARARRVGCVRLAPTGADWSCLARRRLIDSGQLISRRPRNAHLIIEPPRRRRARRGRAGPTRAPTLVVVGGAGNRARRSRLSGPSEWSRCSQIKLAQIGRITRAPGEYFLTSTLGCKWAGRRAACVMGAHVFSPAAAQPEPLGCGLFKVAELAGRRSSGQLLGAALGRRGRRGRARRCHRRDHARRLIGASRPTGRPACRSGAKQVNDGQLGGLMMPREFISTQAEQWAPQTKADLAARVGEAGWPAGRPRGRHSISTDRAQVDAGAGN